MLYQRQNFSGLGRLPKFREGDVFEDCNLAQEEPNTPVATGAKGLIFRRCNLVNCDLPPDAVIESSLHCQVPKPIPVVKTPKEIAEEAEETALAETVRQSFQPQIDAAVAAAIAALLASRLAVK